MQSIPQPKTSDNPLVALHPLIAALPPGGEIPLYVPERPKPVAGVCMLPNGLIELHKWLLGSIHIMRDKRIGFNDPLYQYARELGATVIKVKDRETDTVYTTDAATFDRYSFVQDFDHGRQRFLKLEFWSINGAPPTYTPPAARAPQVEELQLGLFAGGAR